jgi:F-box domain.
MENLPKEIIIKIFDFLHYRDRCKFRLVNKYWDIIITSGSLKLPKWQGELKVSLQRSFLNIRYISGNIFYVHLDDSKKSISNTITLFNQIPFRKLRLCSNSCIKGGWNLGNEHGTIIYSDKLLYGLSKRVESVKICLKNHHEKHEMEFLSHLEKLKVLDIGKVGGAVLRNLSIPKRVEELKLTCHRETRCKDIAIFISNTENLTTLRISEGPYCIKRRKGPEKYVPHCCIDLLLEKIAEKNPDLFHLFINFSDYKSYRRMLNNSKYIAQMILKKEPQRTEVVGNFLTIHFNIRYNKYPRLVKQPKWKCEVC